MFTKIIRKSRQLSTYVEVIFRIQVKYFFIFKHPLTALLNVKVQCFVMFTIATCLMIFIEKKRALIRILLWELKKNDWSLKQSGSSVWLQQDEAKCSLWFFANCKINQIITVQRSQNILLNLQKCVQHVISFSFAANMK